MKPDHEINWQDAHARLSVDYFNLEHRLSVDYFNLEQRMYKMRNALERAQVALRLSHPKEDSVELKLRHSFAELCVSLALKGKQP